MFTPHLNLKMTTAKVDETSVDVNNNSPSQDYTNLDDLHPQTCNDTLRFKPFTLVHTLGMLPMQDELLMMFV